MAAETRSFPAMNVEPTHPSEAKRPKGFVRGNWGAMLFVAGLLILSFLRFAVLVGGAKIGFLVLARDGCIGFSITEQTQDVPFVSESRIRWASFAIGSNFAFGTEAGLRMNLPIWCVAVLPLAWIAFREWRRKRAAKGSASA
jgi:hypothetical protein